MGPGLTPIEQFVVQCGLHQGFLTRPQLDEAMRRKGIAPNQTLLTLLPGCVTPQQLPQLEEVIQRAMAASSEAATSTAAPPPPRQVSLMAPTVDLAPTADPGPGGVVGPTGTMPPTPSAPVGFGMAPGPSTVKREDVRATVASPTPLPAPAAGGSPTLAEPSALGGGTLAPPGVQAAEKRKKVGRYAVVGEIGRGGMGIVYRGRDERLDRDVAIKLLIPSVKMSAYRVKRFGQEAKAVARLLHPGIVQVFDTGEEDGACYMVMEFVEGESLAQYLEREGPLDSQGAAELLFEVAEALEYAHSKGILHRDIKPDNILIAREDGLPKLTDFGLARLTGAEDGAPKDGDQTQQAGAPKARLTADGQFMGTPAYMPPEQAAGERDKIDARSDVYSLGATLYEMLTGRLPFEGQTAINIITNLLNSDAPPPSTITQTIDPALEAICLKCIAKDPEDRYSSAEELATALEGYLHAAEDDEQPASRGRKTTPASDSASNVPVAWIAAPLGTLALVGLIFLAFGGDPEPPPEDTPTNQSAALPPAKTKPPPAKTQPLAKTRAPTKTPDTTPDPVTKSGPPPPPFKKTGPPPPPFKKTGPPPPPFKKTDARPPPPMKTSERPPHLRDDPPSAKTKEPEATRTPAPPELDPLVKRAVKAQVDSWMRARSPDKLLCTCKGLGAKKCTRCGGKGTKKGRRPPPPPHRRGGGPPPPPPPPRDEDCSSCEASGYRTCARCEVGFKSSQLKKVTWELLSKQARSDTKRSELVAQVARGEGPAKAFGLTLPVRKAKVEKITPAGDDRFEVTVRLTWIQLEYDKSRKKRPWKETKLLGRYTFSLVRQRGKYFLEPGSGVTAVADKRTSGKHWVKGWLQDGKLKSGRWVR